MYKIKISTMQVPYVHYPNAGIHAYADLVLVLGQLPSRKSKPFPFVKANEYQSCVSTGLKGITDRTAAPAMYCMNTGIY